MCMGVNKKVSKKSTVYWQQKEGYVLTFLYTMWSTHGWGGGGGGGYRSFSFNEICSQQTYYLSMRFPSPVCTKCIRE